MSFVVRGPESMAGGSLYSSYVLEEKTTKCERFRKYMWNAEETTCCKRTPKYWCKLILFYTLFAALIFGVFFLSLHYISIFIRDSSDAKKNLIEDNCPGISFLPKIGDERSHLIWYSFTGKQRLDYTDHIKRYLEKYECTDADSTCIFPLANLSVCSKEDYGFKEKKPCFYLKLNKFSEWEPEYYSKILPQYMPSSLKKIISKSSTKEQFQKLDQRAQLSPQQQGQILSDIQQHQHRFSIPQSNQQQFPPQHFRRHQQIVAQSGLFNQPLPTGPPVNTNQQPILSSQIRFPQSQSRLNEQNLNTQQQIYQNTNFPQQHPSTNSNFQDQQIIQNQQNILQNQQILNSQHLSNQQSLASIFPTSQSNLPLQPQLQPSILPTPGLTPQTILTTNQPVQKQINSQNVLPTPEASLSPQNVFTNDPQVTHPSRVIQHHTQTSFTPNFAQQNKQLRDTFSTFPPQQQFFSTRPTVDPVLAISHQIQQLDPEKHKQRIKELRDKQAIIEKHNQFVERQYEKALKKAQADHLDFIEQQKEQKKKLYQKIYKPPGAETLRYSQSIPRYIYPEETPLFERAVSQYYNEHPTTTTTTTTPPPTTTEKKVVKKPKSSFLPTALPATNQSKIKRIESIDDLDQLQKQYKSQQIKKDDLLEQLRLAIGKTSDDNVTKNLASREISLANGKKVQLIETNDPKLIPNGKTEEITLPNGEKVQLFRADNPDVASKRATPKLDEITLPNGQKVKLLHADPNITLKGRKIKPEEITLPNGRKIQVIKTTDPKLIPGNKSTTPSVKTEIITLPNGEKVEVFKTTDPKLVPGAEPLEPGSELEKLVFSRTTTTTTVKPPKAILEELTKGVVPPGANFELLKTGASGGLEQIGGIPASLPNQKKVTFVLLEEQTDGTLKVQGVKGSGKDKPEVDVDSILKKIKDGEIKLPPVQRPSSTAKPVIKLSSTTTKPGYVSDVTVVPNSFPIEEVSGVPVTKPKILSQYVSSTEPTTLYTKTLYTNLNDFSSEGETSRVPILKTNIGTHFIATSTPASNIYSKVFTTSTPKISTVPTESITTYRSEKKFVSSREPHILNHPSNDLVRQASSVTSINQNSILSGKDSSSSNFLPKPSSTSFPFPTSTVTVQQSISPALVTNPNVHPTSSETPSPTTPTFLELPDILKKRGLYAMAKFLRQSGLDTILNETGPYTVFAPTDKAFRTLLVQLGGPEKADEKFKENPRLLSGLLLHHIIPGAFALESLQDEMTGVSLAGTQLRVNQYSMHDVEWNDVKITTINGAKVLEDKKDIEIPQGIAHAVDRVMFPLPVGDIVQTLQADRERRFTSILRAIFSSGLADMLQGQKTFTLFAPTDKAFAGFSSQDLTRMVTDRNLSKELILRHLTPSTLYTNGMRYYQIRDSLQPDRQITLSKQSSKVKVNNIQIGTQNIPATNGVIHAIDTLL